MYLIPADYIFHNRIWLKLIYTKIVQIYPNVIKIKIVRQFSKKIKLNESFKQSKTAKMQFICLYYIANIHGYIVYILLAEEWNIRVINIVRFRVRACAVWSPVDNFRTTNSWSGKKRMTERKIFSECLHTPEQNGTGMISELSFNGTHVFASYKHTIPSLLIHLPWLKAKKHFCLDFLEVTA